MSRKCQNLIVLRESIRCKSELNLIVKPYTKVERMKSAIQLEDRTFSCDVNPTPLQRRPFQEKPLQPNIAGKLSRG